jgi:hypothetical protein
VGLFKLKLMANTVHLRPFLVSKSCLSDEFFMTFIEGVSLEKTGCDVIIFS